jgi:hypothetical protein
MLCESRMRKIRISCLMRGKEVIGHCLCALILWLLFLLYLNLLCASRLSESLSACSNAALRLKLGSCEDGYLIKYAGAARSSYANPFATSFVESPLRLCTKRMLLKIPPRSRTLGFPRDLAPDEPTPRITPPYSKSPYKILPLHRGSKIHRQIR